MHFSEPPSADCLASHCSCLPLSSATSCLPSPEMCGPLASQMPAPTYEASPRSENLGSGIGKSVPTSPVRLPSLVPSQASPPSPTWSPVARRRLWSTSGRMTQGMETPLSSAPPPSGEMNPPTGNRSGSPLFRDESVTCQPIFVFVVIELSPLLLATLLVRLLKSGLLSCIGVQLVVENQEGPSWKPESKLTLKIQEPSFGVGTVAKNLLSLTNLEELSTSPICSDGWIGTRYLLKPRDPQPLFAQ